MNIFKLVFDHFLTILSNSVFADEPEIEVEAEKVHSGVGKEAHLSCIVHGDPKPSVSLFVMADSPGLVVMGDDSCLRGCGFESWRTETISKSFSAFLRK